MNWKDKKVLITGSEGFIGSHLTERIVDLGANVTAFVKYNSNKDIGFIETFDKEVRDKIKIEFGDVLELETMQKALKDIDVVFHLAASISVPYSFRHPEEVISINSKGTLNVLTAAKNQGVSRILTTSSSEVYGTAKFIPITEEHPLQAQSPYAASKIAADKFAESFFKTYGLPVTIVRPFNNYGPRQSARAVIPTIITQALTLNKIKLGAVSPRRDFLYVRDTCDGFVKIAESNKVSGEVINLATGKDISIGELAKLICKIIGKDMPIKTDEQRIRPKNAEVDVLCGDASKAKRLVGWKPKTSLEKGLKKTIKWISNNLDIYKPKEYLI